MRIGNSGNLAPLEPSRSHERTDEADRRDTAWQIIAAAKFDDAVQRTKLFAETRQFHRGTLWVSPEEEGESLSRISAPKATAAIRLVSPFLGRNPCCHQPTIIREGPQNSEIASARSQDRDPLDDGQAERQPELDPPLALFGAGVKLSGDRRPQDWVLFFEAGDLAMDMTVRIAGDHGRPRMKQLGHGTGKWSSVFVLPAK